MATLKARKAIWTPEFHKIYVDLCLEQTLNGNRPGTHLTKAAWMTIEESFHKKTGVKYDRKQLKNHWDNTKEQWKIWCKLIGTSSMKWDPNAQKFGANEEDWANYIETNPEAAPYRFKELLFSDTLDVIYEGTTASGETEPPSRRRKHHDGSATPTLRTQEVLGMRPESRCERCCDAVESRSTVTVQSSSLGKLNYSIAECIEWLDAMVEVQQGSELYLFALDLFLKKKFREIFLTLKKPNVRIAWLQRLQSIGPPLPLR